MAGAVAAATSAAGASGVPGQPPALVAAAAPAQYSTTESVEGWHVKQAIAYLLARGVSADQIVVKDEDGNTLTPEQVNALPLTWVVKDQTPDTLAAGAGSGAVTIVVGPPGPSDEHADDPIEVQLVSRQFFGLVAGMALVAVSILLAASMVSRSLRERGSMSQHKM
ncbi:MAG: hypothetical protein EYC70_01655 [Planctomycetota bacterium]|nr:MAG: hypothetical protein EYC70_01655 [Planctomycetota bacterium]